MRKTMIALFIIVVLTVLSGCSLSGPEKQSAGSQVSPVITISPAGKNLFDDANTRVSSGTGGEVPLIEEKDLDRGIRWKRHGENGRRGLYVKFPQKPDLEKEINQWINAKRNELLSIPGVKSMENIEERAEYCGRLLNIDLSIYPYIHNEEYNHIYSFVERCAVFDIRKGRQVNLSDLFYNDFNYIQYINSYIEFQLLKNDTGEELKRPFEGFDKNYTVFQVRRGNLYIKADENNYFFINRYNVDIPLLPKISPWGKINCTVSYQRRVFRNFSVDVPTVHINGGKKNVEKRINEGIACLINKIKNDKQIIGYYSRRRGKLYLNISQDGNYFTLIYSNESWYMPNYMMSLAAATFDLKNGRKLRYQDLVKEVIPRKNILRYWDITQLFEYKLEKISGYAPPYGSKYTDVWVDYEGTYVKLIEPSGAVVSMLLKGLKKMNA